MSGLDGIIVRDTTKIERAGTHSHITGLGLLPNLEAEDSGCGMVGQKNARKAAGIIVEMIKRGKIAGKAILLSGEPGTGKTALAKGIAKSLGSDTPFVSITGSEVYSMSMKKTEFLHQALRKAIAVKIKEEIETLEGEVVSLTIERPENGLGKKTGMVCLKTTDIESEYKLGAKMAEAMIKEDVQVGDVVQIDKQSGACTKLGQSYSFKADYDAVGSQFKSVATPSGEIQKRRPIVHTVSLHEIDVLNSGSGGYMSIFAGDTGEISGEVRAQITAKVTEWQNEKKADIIPGVLFIDEVHTLDLECYSFLNTAIESGFSPILIMATNRREGTIKGSNIQSPHCLPLDLLDRAHIIATEKYSSREKVEIIKIKANEEGIDFPSEDSEFLRVFMMFVTNNSLRYCMNLLTMANQIRQRNSHKAINATILKRACGLFIDAQLSSKKLDSQSELYINDI